MFLLLGHIAICKLKKKNCIVKSASIDLHCVVIESYMKTVSEHRQKWSQIARSHYHIDSQGFECMDVGSSSVEL